MIRFIVTAIWLLLSAWLAIWAGEGLFRVDQRESILPFRGDDPMTPALMIGVAWGIILTFGGSIGPAFSTGRGRRGLLLGELAIGIGTLIEASRTGTTINEVPQYDLYLRVQRADGSEFISAIRMLVSQEEAGALLPGTPFPVRYAMNDADTIEIADPHDPAVRDALLDWRIARGLMDPRLVRARKEGLQVPASVLSVRPTGKRIDNQSELHLRVLMAPEGQPTWEADTTVFVYPEAVARVQVGSPIWAFYLREDPHTVAVTIEKEAGR